MRKGNQFIAGLIGLLAFIGIGYFLYKAVSLLILNFDKININIFVAIIGGTITITSFFITRYLEKRKNIEMNFDENSSIEELVAQYEADPKAFSLPQKVRAENAQIEDVNDYFQELKFRQDFVCVIVTGFRHDFLSYSQLRMSFFSKVTPKDKSAAD